MSIFTRRKHRTPRRYIPAALGVAGFFDKLNTQNVRYACLRWHHDLPAVKAGEDIDLLVADEDVALAEALLTGSKRNGIPVDLYTASGMPGTNYCTVAYFVPELAAAALRQPVAYKSQFKIPDAVSYFYTMCYHVVYHKGLRSGLPEKIGDALSTAADHNYADAIAELAREAKLPVPEMSLKHLDGVLSEAGWRPSNDTLRKYSKRNEWLRGVLAAESNIDDVALNGLAVFIVRERARDLTDEISALLRDNGFETIAVEDIAPHDIARVASQLRGGNWNRGPWPLSGGNPTKVIVGYDCFPHMVPSPENPLEMCNRAVQDVKERVRRELRKRHPETENYNAVHSSDTPKDALDYMAIIDPALEARCRARAQQIAGSSELKFQVIERLDSFGRRSKVERVAYGNGTAICKTFRPGAERYLERELLARRMFKNNESVVPVLESGPNYFVMPDVARNQSAPGTLRPYGASKPLIPVAALAACRNLIAAFRKQGFELIDFSPQNLLFDQNGRPRFIDFEFLQKGSEATPSLVGNYAWWPPPDEFSGDFPNISRKRNPYNSRWFDRTGVPRVIAVRVQTPAMWQVFQVLGFVYISLRNAPKELFRFVRKAIRGR